MMYPGRTRPIISFSNMLLFSDTILLQSCLKIKNMLTFSLLLFESLSIEWNIGYEYMNMTICYRLSCTEIDPQFYKTDYRHLQYHRYRHKLTIRHNQTKLFNLLREV